VRVFTGDIEHIYGPGGDVLDDAELRARNQLALENIQIEKQREIEMRQFELEVERFRAEQNFSATQLWRWSIRGLEYLGNGCAHTKLGCVTPNLEGCMAKLKTLGAVTFLSFALASAVSAQQVTKSSGDRTKGTVGTNTAASKNGTSDSRSGRSDGVAGRPGVSCQRDTFFTGEDGQRHLCK
jgi:hypothetical protein